MGHVRRPDQQLASSQRHGSVLAATPIAKTLHSRQRSHTRRYLTYLLASKPFSPTIHKALTESPVGKPLVNPHYPLSSPLLVQHGYHLTRLLESTDFDLSRLRLVVEFGGGYGSFFRLLYNLGYRKRYVIVICPSCVLCSGSICETCFQPTLAHSRG